MFNHKASVILKAKLLVLIAIIAIFLPSCNTASDKKQTDSTQVLSKDTTSVVLQTDTLDSLIANIINISASDFQKNQQPLPINFKDVKLRFSIKPNKETLYILCGEFITQDKLKSNEWTHFTTIKNSDYEQWIGPNGLTYCDNSKEILYTKADLSEELLKQLHKIQANNNK